MSGSTPSTPSSTTQNVNSIPEFLQPYVSTLVGSAESQIYKKDKTGAITGMQPYVPYAKKGEAYVAPLTALQKKAATQAGALQTPGQFQQGTGIAGAAASQAYNAGVQSSDIGGQAMDIGNQGLGIGAQGMDIGNQAVDTGNLGVGIGLQGLGIGAQGMDIGNQGIGIGAQGLDIGAQAMGAQGNYNAQATDPNSMAQWMSPYMQNVVDWQTQQANRQFDISGTQQMGSATQRGAFGGSREALMAAENERNRNQAITGIQATGAQNAYQQAQAAQQFGANLGMQGYGVGLQGVEAAQQGISAGLQGAGIGLQGLSAAQQGVSAGLQGAGVGLQGVSAAQQGVSSALQGAGLGLQGEQQAISAAGQGVGAASVLGGLGTAELGAQRDIITTETQQGAIQQAQEQAKIDVQIANQAKSQSYPMEQLGQMSSLLRGIPTQTTTSVYNAQPSTSSQVLSALGSAGSLYGAAKAAKGGIVGFDVGGAIESDLKDMNKDQLQKVIQEATSDTEKSLAKRILAEKSMAGGGIVAFPDGGAVSIDPLLEEQQRAEAARIAEQERLTGLPAVEAVPAIELPTGIKKAIPKKALKNPIKKQQLFSSLEEDNNLPLGTLDTVWGLESSRGKNMGPSKSNAKGHFQFMPGTAKQYGVKDVNDLTDSSTGAANYLGDLNEKYGDIGLAAAAYNWGPANVDKWRETGTGLKGKPMPEETVNYMNKVQSSLGMTPTGIAQLTRPAGDEPIEDQATATEQPSKAMALLDEEGKRREAEAGKSVRDIMEEQAGLRKEMGLDTNEATQQYRADLMAERANAGKEKERQSYLRAAQFFAHWGSTPGPVIVAGLTALKETMPGYLEDIKDQKKLKKELDKGIFEMNQADRLEQQGYMKEAAAIKEKASDALMKHHNLYAEAMLNKETEAAKMASQEKIAAGDVKGRETVAGLRATGAGGDTETHLRQTLAFKYKTVTDELKKIEAKSILGKAPKEGSPDYALYTSLIEKKQALTDQISTLGSPSRGLTIGQVEDGHVYQGGDPKDEANWLPEE